VNILQVPEIRRAILIAAKVFVIWDIKPNIWKYSIWNFLLLRTD